MKQFQGTIRLPKCLYNAPPEPKVEKKEPARKGKAKYPDEDILQMRRMHEVEGKSLKDVAAYFPELQEQYVRNVLNYTVRSKLLLKV